MPHRLITTVFALSLIILGSSSIQAEESDSLVLAGPPWAPYLDKESDKLGFAVEVVTRAFSKLETETEPKIVPWRRVIWVAQNAQADGLIGVWHQADREEFLIFSEPYYKSPMVAAYHKDEPLPGCTVSDLAGKRVGMRDGAWYGEKIMKDEDMRRVGVSHDLSILRMLRQGRLDGAIGDGLILSSLIEEHPELSESLRICETALDEIPLHFAAVRGADDASEVVDLFNQGLRELRESNEYKRIQERYGLPEFE